MKIGILGAGRMGQGVAELLGEAGHTVGVGSRTPGATAFPTISVGAAIEGSDVVVVSWPHEAIEANLDLLSTIAPGTVVIDLANAVRPVGGRIRSAIDQPHGQWVADRLPHVLVARAFTHIPDPLLLHRARSQPDIWAIAVAADHDEALATAEQLVRDAKYVPVPVGRLADSWVLDPGGPLFPNAYLPQDMHDLIVRAREEGAAWGREGHIQPAPPP